MPPSDFAMSWQQANCFLSRVRPGSAAPGHGRPCWCGRCGRDLRRRPPQQPDAPAGPLFAPPPGLAPAQTLGGAEAGGGAAREAEEGGRRSRPVSFSRTGIGDEGGAPAATRHRRVAVLHPMPLVRHGGPLGQDRRSLLGAVRPAAQVLDRGASGAVGRSLGAWVLSLRLVGEPRLCRICGRMPPRYRGAKPPAVPTVGSFRGAACRASGGGSRTPTRSRVTLGCSRTNLSS